MVVIRILALLALLGIGGALLAWFFTGDAKYRLWAWNFFRAGLVVLLVFLAAFAVERITTPIG